MSYNPQYPVQTSMVRRRMTEPEMKLVVKSTTQMRSVVQGMGFASIFVAAFSIYWPNGLFSLITMSLAMVVLVLTAQYARTRSRLKDALVKGEVVDVRGVARKVSSPKGWQVGALKLPWGTHLSSRLQDGRQTTLTCMPAMKALLAIDGSLLGGSMQVTSPANAWDGATQAIPAAPVEDDPPPPED
jgi:hypothetical protein